MMRMKFGLAICIAGAAVWHLAGCGAAGGTLEPVRFAQVPAGHMESTVYYPKGDPTESVLMMRTTAPETVREGEEFEYKIELYNPTDNAIIKNIVVADHFSDGFELVSSTPTWTDLNVLEEKDPYAEELRNPYGDLDDISKSAPSMIRGRYVSVAEPHDAERAAWFISELYPEKLVTIRVRGKATAEGEWISCATASYDLAGCLAGKVTAPDLRVVTDIDRDFILCETDEADIAVRVSNTGSGRTEDVTVRVQLPDGLSYNGSQTITERVGQLPAGETKRFSKSVRVDAPGTYVVRATARSETGISSDAAATTLTAREAVLEVDTMGPQTEYVGLPVEYEIRVSNVGNAPARNLVIRSEVPSGAEFVDATNNGKRDGNVIRWQLGELPAGQYVPLTVRYEATEDGFMRNVVTASSECSADMTALARTQLEGVAAMVVELVDTEDPIKIGGEEVYEIRVHNQGSEPQTDVLVACEVPDGMRFISASGSTEARSGVGAKRVLFEPVPALAANDTARWKVRVRGTDVGDLRFRVAVESDQHGRPVRESEATRVFK